MTLKNLYGGLEGGGSKFVCAVGDGSNEVLEEIRFPTTTPDETLEIAIGFFKRFNLAGISLAQFGPLDLDPDSPTYGAVTATTKPGWSGAEILSRFRGAFQVPVAIDLDVNAAAFGEYSLALENQCTNPLVYFTIGTGIGAGIVVNGRILHGLTHPEAGHVRIPHDRAEDPFPGCCPFHADCFEGLASGTALANRYGQPAENLPDNHPAWELEAKYIAFALANVICTISPQRIILGGGVMSRVRLFPLIWGKVQRLLNDYIASPVIANEIQTLIVPPGLGRRSGILGAIALAKGLVEGE